MCLENASSSTHLFDQEDEITVYKVLRLNNYSPYFDFKYREGVNEPLFEGIIWDKTRDKVYGGVLHCFIKQEDAEKLIEMLDNQHKVVELRARKEDFVAEGRFEYWSAACFLKLYINEGDLNVSGS